MLKFQRKSMGGSFRGIPAWPVLLATLPALRLLPHIHREVHGRATGEEPASLQNSAPASGWVRSPHFFAIARVTPSAWSSQDCFSFGKQKVTYHRIQAMREPPPKMCLLQLPWKWHLPASVCTKKRQIIGAKPQSTRPPFASQAHGQRGCPRCWGGTHRCANCDLLGNGHQATENQHRVQPAMASAFSDQSLRCAVQVF